MLQIWKVTTLIIMKTCPCNKQIFSAVSLNISLEKKDTEVNCTRLTENLYLKYTQIETIWKGLYFEKKVRVGNGQEMAQSERNSHSKIRGRKKTKLTIRYLY